MSSKYAEKTARLPNSNETRLYLAIEFSDISNYPHAIVSTVRVAEKIIIRYESKGWYAKKLARKCLLRKWSGLVTILCLEEICFCCSSWPAIGCGLYRWLLKFKWYQELHSLSNVLYSCCFGDFNFSLKPFGIFWKSRYVNITKQWLIFKNC